MRPASALPTARRQKFADDPHWRDLVLFHEYFHGDTGAGIGATHQTGWTGCVAAIIKTNAVFTKELLLAPGAEDSAPLRTVRSPSSRSDRAKTLTRSRADEDMMKNYYSDKNLPEPVVPAVQALTLLKGQAGAGHRRQLRHRPRDCDLTRTCRR